MMGKTALQAPILFEGIQGTQYWSFDLETEKPGTIVGADD